MSWEDLRRYWRRVYGFILSEKPQPCVAVTFSRFYQRKFFGNFQTYLLKYRASSTVPDFYCVIREAKSPKSCRIRVKTELHAESSNPELKLTLKRPKRGR